MEWIDREGNVWLKACQQLSRGPPPHPGSAYDFPNSELQMSCVQTNGLSIRPSLTSCSDLINYLKPDMTKLCFERVRALHFNDSDAMICDDVVGEGTIDSAPVSIRTIVSQALAHGSVALVLAHNHPIGGAEPSEADYYMTRKLTFLCASIDVRVYDHLIIAEDRYFSFRERGLL